MPTLTKGRIVDKFTLIGGESNNAYIYRDPSKSGKWHLYFINKETNQRHRLLLKHSDGRYPDKTSEGKDEANRLGMEKFIELRTRTDRGEVIHKLSIYEMCNEFIEKESRRIRTTPHEGITAARFRLIKNQVRHFQEFCSNKEFGCGYNVTKSVHTLRRSFLDQYQTYRENTTNQKDKRGRQLPRPHTLNGELSTIKRLFREVALARGFITRDQMPDFPYARVGRLAVQDTRRQSFTPDEWVKLERCARLYWSKGLSRYNKDGSDRGYLPLKKGKNKGKPSNQLDLRNNLYGVNKGKGSVKSTRAQHQLDHRQMIYLAARISMESGIRIGSLRKMRWCDIKPNKSASLEDQKKWVIIDVPAENTKTGRFYQIGAPIARYLERLKYITKGKSTDLIFRNQTTGKRMSSRIWIECLYEMLVEAGLATWSPRDNNNCRQIDTHSGKTFSWYSFRHTFITFALNRNVPITTVCSNCDTSIKYVQDHYFHYDAAQAIDALSEGRKRPYKSAMSDHWMLDIYVNDEEEEVEI